MAANPVWEAVPFNPPPANLPAVCLSQPPRQAFAFGTPPLPFSSSPLLDRICDHPRHLRATSALPLDSFRNICILNSQVQKTGPIRSFTSRTQPPYGATPPRLPVLSLPKACVRLSFLASWRFNLQRTTDHGQRTSKTPNVEKSRHTKRMDIYVTVNPSPTCVNKQSTAKGTFGAKVGAPPAEKSPCAKSSSHQANDKVTRH
jgi:hypothetical protein